MSFVGIIANPAAGKDIRRIVARGRFVPNHEKVNILKRVLAGLDAAGVERVAFMPDAGGLGRAALDGADLRLSAEFVDMPVFHAERDTLRAARAMREAGVRCIVTLGGDGTNRAAAKECGDIPIMPVSTGTNNVFPAMVEGTVAGLAAGRVATGAAPADRAAPKHARLEALVDGEPRDIALVDLAISTERFVGARAIWDVATVRELFLTRAEATSVGLSAIGARLRPVSPTEGAGLRIRFGEGGETVIAPVAPGLIQRAPIAEWRMIKAGGAPEIVKTRPATAALDGERAFSVPPDAEFSVRLSADGPRVVDAGLALSGGG